MNKPGSGSYLHTGYSGLADCDSSLGFNGNVPPKEAFPRPKAAAQKALEIDDTLAEAHASLGYIKIFYDWDWSGAEKEYQRAIELSPSYALSHQWYGITLLSVGRFEESIAEYKRAVELAPLSLSINRGFGVAFYEARQYDQAIQQERKTLPYCAAVVSGFVTGSHNPRRRATGGSVLVLSLNWCFRGKPRSPIHKAVEDMPLLSECIACRNGKVPYRDSSGV